jgi:hypothetical protein
MTFADFMLLATFALVIGGTCTILWNLRDSDYP